MVVVRLQAGSAADRAADVFGLTAGATDKMMVVVAHAVFVARRRIRGLDAADDAFFREDVQDVIDRLTRDRADLLAGALGDGIGGRMRMAGDRAQHRQALRRDRQLVLAKGGFRVPHVDPEQGPVLDFVKKR